MIVLFRWQWLNTCWKKYNIDSNRVFLAGTSAGGHGGWEVAALYPYRFAGMISIAAAPRLHNWGYLPNLYSLPICALAGKKDEPLLLRNLRAACGQLRRKNRRTLYYELPKYGHGIPLRQLLPQLIKWLKHQRRGSHPRSVEFCLSDCRYGRASWLEVLQLQGKVYQPGDKIKVYGAGHYADPTALFIRAVRSRVARIVARIDSGNSMVIKTRKVAKLRIYFPVGLLNFSGKVKIYINGKRRYYGRIDIRYRGTCLKIYA